MIDIPDLTPHLLAELGEELGGCDFTHESQTRFLGCRTSCDVQAVPGNGKTTLLAAKLALLSRTWRSRTQGVCVISHTNAARHEVERNLLQHPTASAFLSYPAKAVNHYALDGRSCRPSGCSPSKLTLNCSLNGVWVFVVPKSTISVAFRELRTKWGAW